MWITQPSHEISISSTNDAMFTTNKSPCKLISMSRNRANLHFLKQNLWRKTDHKNIIVFCHRNNITEAKLLTGNSTSGSTHWPSGNQSLVTIYYFSVLPRPFLQDVASCPFLVTPCLFKKLKWCPAFFNNKNTFFGKKRQSWNDALKILSQDSCRLETLRTLNILFSTYMFIWW